MKFFTHLTSTRIRGFSLVETLVSTFIVTLVIVGPLTVASNASTYAKTTKDTMVASYLAQEAIELLRHHQDSIYIRCASLDSLKCSATTGETPSEAAWRLFKARLANNAQGVSCMASENASGCSYDVVDMTDNEDVNPTKYVSTTSACGTLSYDASLHMYVCTGIRGEGLPTSPFSRSVSIVSVPTILGADQQYNDDLKVTVTITLRRANGYTHEIKVVDFLHARA